MCSILQKMIGILVHTATHAIFIENSLLCFTSLTVPESIFTIPIFPSSITDQLLSSLFLHTAYNLLQDIFPYLNHFPNSGRIEGPMDKGVWWGLALFNLLQPLRFMGRDNCTNNYWFLIAQAQKTVLLQVLISEEGISDQNGKPSNPPSRILSTYFYYFHTLLI